MGKPYEYSHLAVFAYIYAFDKKLARKPSRKLHRALY